MLVRLRIGHELTLALAALLLTTVAAAVVGITSLGDVNHRAQLLYNDNVRTTEATSAVQQARTVAEKVRAAVEAIVLSNLELRVTASLGVARLPDDCSDADSLVRAADRALYAAKGRGRNRVELFESRQDRSPEPAPAGP
jgi:GGDEF domain-containing protein